LGIELEYRASHFGTDFQFRKVLYFKGGSTRLPNYANCIAMDRGTSTGTRARLRNRFCFSDPVDWNDPMVFDWQVGKVDLGASRVQNGSL
jgi:hypothetical protein